MYLRGFDRRGCAASLNNASASGFTVSGVFSDQADFAVLVLFDADDQFGHLFTTKYLPDFSLAGVTLDFDLAITNAQNPVSRKFQSVPWGALSYITKSETPGTVSLQPMATSATGMAAASQTFTVNGTPVAVRPRRARLSEQHRLRLPGLDCAVAGPSEPGDLRVLQRTSGRDTTTRITIGSSTYIFTAAIDRRFVRRHRYRAWPPHQRVRRSELLRFGVERQQRDRSPRGRTRARSSAVGASDGNGPAHIWLATIAPQFIAAQWPRTSTGPTGTR